MVVLLSRIYYSITTNKSRISINTKTYKNDLWLLRKKNYIKFKDSDIDKVKTAVNGSITLLMTNTDTNTETWYTSNKSFLSKLINPTIIIALISATIYIYPKMKVKSNNKLDES
jgi:hypothetical protein